MNNIEFDVLERTQIDNLDNRNKNENQYSLYNLK